MTDMLVNLYEVREPVDPHAPGTLDKRGITLQRALAADRKIICRFINEQFSQTSPGWEDECIAALNHQPPGCYIAIHNKQVIGFACYDATAKGMVGPVGVAKEFRKLGIARALLMECFNAMKMDGYAYAVIGWVNSTEYYEYACGATVIPNSSPGIYSRMVNHEKEGQCAKDAVEG